MKAPQKLEKLEKQLTAPQDSPVVWNDDLQRYEDKQGKPLTAREIQALEKAAGIDLGPLVWVEDLDALTPQEKARTIVLTWE